MCALVKLAKFLKTHGDVIVGNKGNVLVSRRGFQVDYFQNTLSFLKQHKCLVKLVPNREIVGGVREFSQNDWDLVLVDFDFFVVHREERVLIITPFRCISCGPLGYYGLALHSGNRLAARYRGARSFLG